MAALVLACTGVFLVASRPDHPSNSNTTNTATLNANAVSSAPMANTTPEPLNTNTSPPLNTNSTNPSPAVVEPIANFATRVTKKPFGIYITPKTSPIQPEKFTGYHTGADAETTAAEADQNTPIFAIASGSVVFADHVNGYGGVMIIKHTIGGKKLLSLYGHLRISSFTVTVGKTVTPGQRLAYLGTGFSSETDHERKHLHFGLINGWTITYKGYVTTKSALSSWMNPASWLAAHE